MSSRKATIVGALFALASLALFPFAGCALDSSGLPGKNNGEPCDAAAQCDDGNACTADACSGGFCAHEPVPDGDSPAQVAADCHKLICASGKEATVDDDTDVLLDDSDCTLDACSGGVAMHPLKANGESCVFADQMGTCSAGVCEIACGSGSPPCDDKNVCTADACDLARAKCVFSKLDGALTPGVAAVKGDCHIHLCVAGVDTNVIDNTDLPAASSDCLSARCDKGESSTPPRPIDSFCGASGGGFCDGAGSCVACNHGTQCPGAVGECRAAVCQASTCSLQDVADGIPVSMQIPGDCKSIVCNGKGSTKVVDSSSDVENDNNTCTTDSCFAGFPQHQSLPAGTSCGNALSCNLFGLCVGCTTNSQCMSPDTCGGGSSGDPSACGCTKTTCIAAGKTCGIIPDGCTGSLNCNGGFKDGTETDTDCGGSAAACGARCAQGKKCLVGADCASGFCADGVCCNEACSGECSACTAAKKGSGSDGICGPIALGGDPDSECAAQDVSTCGTTGVCDGLGACQRHAAGSVCAPASCQAGANVLTKADTCTGAGVCQDNGTQSCGNYACRSATCLTTCSSEGDCDTDAFCSAPNCLPKKSTGAACNSSKECLNNTSCVDGVCCGSPSCPTCQSCNASSATAGSCANIPAGMPDNEPPGACAVCDGAGQCKKVNGESCAQGSECASQFCVDDVCCASACADACSVCDLPGKVGQCVFVPKGDPDEPLCGGSADPTHACNGSGACLLEGGQTCTMDSECASGKCLGNNRCQ